MFYEEKFIPQIESTMEYDKTTVKQKQSLTVTFDFDIDDMMAFQENYLTNSKRFKNMRLFAILVLPIVSVMLLLWLGIRDGMSTKLIIVAIFLLTASIIWGIIMRSSIKSRSLSKIRKNIIQNDKDNTIILGIREMRFDENGIFLKADKSESLTKWTAVLKVVKGIKYYHLYIASISAFVVPLDKIGDSKSKLDSIISKHVSNIIITEN